MSPYLSQCRSTVSCFLSILWFHCLKSRCVYVFFGFVLFLSLLQEMNERKENMQLPFRISSSADPDRCPFLVVLSRVMGKLPSELKTKQTTCLSKDLSSCPLLNFISYCPFVHQLCYAFSFCVFIAAGVAFWYHETAEKLMHQRTSSRKIHLTWWQLVSIRENLIYLKTISLAISFRLNFAALPKALDSIKARRKEQLHWIWSHRKLWSPQQGC